MDPSRASLWTIGILIAASGIGCSGLPEPFGDGEGESEYCPERVAIALEEADRLQERGELREGIDIVERSLVDYPESLPLKIRLAELRSMRQVCFTNDWSEADSLCETQSHQTALVVLKRIERYGDRDMVRRARERMEEIRASHPEI